MPILAALETNSLDALDHHFSEASAARLAHVFDGAFSASGFDVRAAHRIDQRRLAFEQGRRRSSPWRAISQWPESQSMPPPKLQ